MDGRELDDLTTLLPPLLNSLERLGFVSRYFDPAHFDAIMAAVGEPEAPLRAERHRLSAWAPALADVRDALAMACDAAIAAFDALRETTSSDDGPMAVYRALRELPRAQEALYPLARSLPPVSRYFLDPAVRDDPAVLRRLTDAPPSPDTGVMHVDNDAQARGGCSLYVPEDYDPGRAWPLVVALHGGSGHGRAFLWSWLREARTHGAILVSPTSIGRTWALQGADPDTPNLTRIVEAVRGRWTVDPDRLLLAGMSDGGTFAYVSGLDAASPFTHLAPTAAAFHPMLASFADAERLAGLPIHITHGVRDWMFPVDMAREARRALAAAGANVTYRELDDLAHAWPRELNGEILAWMRST